MVLHGVHPVAELLRRLAAEGRTQQELVLLLARDNAALRRLRRQARDLDIPVREVSVAELSARCRSRAHRGVALVATGHGADGGRQQAARPQPAPAQNRAGGVSAAARGAPAGHHSAGGGLRAHLAASARRPAALVVVADGVSDPMNLGTIIRSADQFGADLVLIPRRRAAPVSDTVMRVSAGAAAHVATVAVANVASALEQLKRIGCWVYGADLEGEALDQVRFPARVALVMGAEGGGLHALVRSRCDHLVRIPTTGRVDSLNVGVAAGILMYEICRQRRAAAAPER